ncbi:MAG: phosphomannomutase/phosphoglucomutase [Bryobacteraceae bacterium]
MDFDESILQEAPLKSADYFRRPVIGLNGFREYDARWRIDNDLNYQGLTTLGRAFGTQLQQEFGVADVIVGFDYRRYSQNVKNAFVIGLLASGADVTDIGLALTPVAYFAQHLLNVKGCAMITASHNENGWTGIKLGYDLSRTFGPDQIERYKLTVLSGAFREGRGLYREARDVGDHYIRDFSSRRLRRRLKVVVATGNGTAGIFTPRVMEEIGCDVVEAYTKLDWDFPHFNPNPEDMIFLRAIGDRVRATGADIGIGIDGDGDRLGIVDEHGAEVFSDKVGLLLARDLVRGSVGATFVVDVKSTGLFFTDEILRSHGARVVFSKTGHSYVKAATHQNGALAGIEKSGHFVFNPPLGRGYDDAHVAAVQVCGMLASRHETLSKLVSNLPTTFQSPTMSPFCADDRKYDVVRKAEEAYRRDFEAGRRIAGLSIKELVTINGVRAVLEDGSWALIRASSNLPCLSIVAESFGSKRQLYDIVGDVADRLKQYPEVGAFDQTLPPYEEGETKPG